MSTAVEQAHEQLVREVAPSYKHKGFDVEIEPSLMEATFKQAQSITRRLLKQQRRAV